MTPTSDERREVAEALRGLRHTTYYSEEVVENIKDAIGTADPVNTFREPEDVYELLADLIDPTCHVSDEEVTHQPTLNAMVVHVYTCDRCSSPFYMGDVCTHPKPLYCPYCGARLVSDDG